MKSVNKNRKQENTRQHIAAQPGPTTKPPSPNIKGRSSYCKNKHSAVVYMLTSWLKWYQLRTKEWHIGHIFNSWNDLSVLKWQILLCQTAVLHVENCSVHLKSATLDCKLCAKLNLWTGFALYVYLWCNSCHFSMLANGKSCKKKKKKACCWGIL